jgi:DNA repair protein RadC
MREREPNKATTPDRAGEIQALPADSRPRERLLWLGERALATSELLSIVIGTGSGEQNALRLSRAMLAHFGDLTGLLRASPTELKAFKGIGEAKALKIKASLELGRRLMTTPAQEPRFVRNSADAANLLIPEMAFLEQEQLRLVLLDARQQVLSIPTIYIGSLNTSVVRVGELFRAAIKENASAFIVAHNHPSSDPSPSPEDVFVTRQIVKAGQLMEIEVLDHIIVGGQRYTSLKERGLAFE